MTCWTAGSCKAFWVSNSNTNSDIPNNQRCLLFSCVVSLYDNNGVKNETRYGTSFTVDTIQLLSLFCPKIIVKNEKIDLVSFVVQTQCLLDVLVFFKMFYLILRVSFLSNVNVHHCSFQTSYSSIQNNFYCVNNFCWE